MAHWPKTVPGKVLDSLLVIAAVPVVLWAAVTLSGPVVWISLGVAALTSIAVYLWRRKLNTAREQTWIGAFSFADVVKGMRAREALQVSARRGHREPSTA
jgi:hypothetical protein